MLRLLALLTATTAACATVQPTPLAPVAPMPAAAHYFCDDPAFQCFPATFRVDHPIRVDTNLVAPRRVPSVG